MAAQHRHAADNGCAVDGIQPTASEQVCFPSFRAPDPPLPLMPNVGPLKMKLGWLISTPAQFG